MAWALLLWGAPRAAVASDDDGFYGRFNGDVLVSAELTGGAMLREGRADAAFSVAARSRFIEMTGLGVGYDRALGGPRTDALWLAADFRPAMAARINFDLQHGPQWLDVTLDSIGVDVGVAWMRPGATASDGAGGAGLALVLGTQVEVPIRWVEGDAVSVRLHARWITARAWDPQGTGRDEDVVEVGLGIVVRRLLLGRIYGRHD